MRPSDRADEKRAVLPDALRARRMSLDIVAIGMVSALGPDAATGCAAARAGISRAAPVEGLRLYSEADWTHVGVAGHSASMVAGGFEGFGKLARLASGALADLLKSHALSAEAWSRTAICLAVPSAYFQAELMAAKGMDIDERERAGEQIRLMLSSLIGTVCRLNGLTEHFDAQFLFPKDQCGFAHALMEADRLTASGRFDRCLVGGVDACTDATALAAAYHFNALKAGDQASGYMPGEAAAFVLVKRAEAAGDDASLARIGAVASAFDSVGRVGDAPPLGVGLASAIDACMGQHPEMAESANWMIGDLNGDGFRANDWGYAIVRLLPAHARLGQCALTLPAESFGEIGAAAGPVAACMAIRAFARGYAPAESVLVWLASYRGHRAAFLLQKSH